MLGYIWLIRYWQSFHSLKVIEYSVYSCVMHTSDIWNCICYSSFWLCDCVVWWLMCLVLYVNSYIFFSFSFIVCFLFLIKKLYTKLNLPSYTYGENVRCTDGNNIDEFVAWFLFFDHYIVCSFSLFVVSLVSSIFSYKARFWI